MMNAQGVCKIHRGKAMPGNDGVWMLCLGVLAAIGLLAAVARHRKVSERRAVAARFAACKARIKQRKRELKEGR